MRGILKGIMFGAVMGTQVAAQELPPLNTPVYRPNCSTGELVAEFTFCSIQMVPTATMTINGVPAIGFISPQPVCRFIRTASESRLDQVRRNLPGHPRAVEQVIEMAEEHFRDPTRACPSLAAF